MHKMKVNRDLPELRAIVKFRNQDKPCMVVHADKAKSDARGLREAASMISGSDRAKQISDWLNEMAAKYEQLDTGPTLHHDPEPNTPNRVVPVQP